MHRRTFVTAACSCGLAATAGCLSAGTAPGAGEDRHPFADATLAVRVDNRSETDHDVETIARESLAFWEEHAREYVDFGVEFEVVEEAEPDIVIAFADDPSACTSVENYSELVLGCAPLIRPGGRARRPVTAHVVAGNRPTGKIRVTTKHELGHIFGLDHDAEPRWIMSDQPADRIPLYDVRIDVWETVLAAHERGTDGARRFGDGVQAWQEADYGTSAERFESARDAYGAMRGLLATAQERTAAFDGHERVETVNLSRLRDLLGRLSRRASAAEWFAFHMAEASYGARAGDTDAAETSVAEANDWVREYNAVEAVELREVAVALGLVRGFERDEAVLDDEEDELDA